MGLHADQMFSDIFSWTIFQRAGEVVSIIINNSVNARLGN